MRDATYITASVVLGTLAVMWVLGRVVGRLREPLAIAAGLVGRIGSAVILVLAAAEVASKGGFWLALVPVLLVPALWNFVLTAGIVWAWASEEPSPNPHDL